MRGFLPIFKRELFALFVTPLAWVLLALFLVVQGIHFFLIATHFASDAAAASDGGPVRAFFGQTILLYLPLLFICPLLTMRTFAEERRSGTIEALLTAPVDSAAVVLAKWAATVTTYLAMWAPTVLYLVLASKGGGDIDWRIVGTSYLGITLVGMGYLAIGTMASAFTKSQLLAAVLAGSILIAFFMLGVGEFIVHEGAAHDLCAHVSVWTLMGEFSQGLVDSRRVVFTSSLVVVPLFITVRTVDSWRWG